MKAIVQDTYGSLDVLELRDIAKPAPGPDDVLVKVHAAGVDPGVWHLTTGMPYLLRIMGFGLRAPKVRVRGLDVAGRVEAVGANVTRFKPGDEVFGTCEGSFAEYGCAPAHKFAPKPARLTFEQAAAVAISGFTALQGLRDQGKVQPGQKVLVIGAAGGVGTYAVQLAKSYGAHVTGVCSTGKTDLVRSIGADEVVDYSAEDVTDGARRYDLVLDIAGHRPVKRLRRALTPRGTLVIVGSEAPGRWFGGVDRLLGALALAPFVRHRLRGLFSAERAEDLEFLRKAIEDGSLTPVVDRTFPLPEVAEAVRYLQEGRARGKVVITV
ncbi:NAD(P)-dependent alcohol dehydrogenase [Streptomyces sp. NPDC051907]|uniref:NAD(P)-dependent alcohol dehydrogenase n=1 Tax=Streptomyces sp. NPDC051907 TaxID=3155284 RepID=UPI003449A167